jgi:folate-dependent phosphoribosylglycinamide formyltransferase PurN
MVNLAILTTKGKNTEAILEYFKDYIDVNISCVIVNDDNLEILKKIRKYKIPRYSTYLYKDIDKILTHHDIHYIIVDYWHEKIPINFCTKYKFKLLNICPLEYLDNKESYLSIIQSKKYFSLIIYYDDEFINDEYIIFKHNMKINDSSIDDINTKITNTENNYYPIIIEKIVRETFDKLF